VGLSLATATYRTKSCQREILTTIEFATKTDICNMPSNIFVGTENFCILMNYINLNQVEG
jgi:hypothetical protein